MKNNLEWDSQERSKVINRILSLTDDQIWALFDKSEISIFDSFDVLLTEIRENGQNSDNLDILLDQSKSKEELMRLITESEKSTKNTSP